MSTDLTTVKDHPATLLRKHYAPIQASLGNDTEAVIYTSAGNALSNYEQVNNVTFAALDNDALSAVREAYETAADTPFGSEKEADALRDLYGAVRDLLGLADD